MSRAGSAQADQLSGSGKSHDRALVLSLVGVLLLVSPLAGIFQLDIKLFGVPFTLIYLFTVWAALIAGTLALSWRLREGVPLAGHDESADAARTSDGGSGSGSPQ